MGPLAGLGAGAGEAAGAGAGAAADVAGAATPLATAGADVAGAVAPAVTAGASDLAAGTAPFLLPGTDTALTAGGALVPQTAFDFATGSALPTVTTAGTDALSGGVTPLGTALGTAGPFADMNVPGSTEAFIASQGNQAFAAPLSGGPFTPDAPIVSADPASATDLSITPDFSSGTPGEITLGSDPGTGTGLPGDVGGILPTADRGFLGGVGDFFRDNSGLIKPALALGGLGLSALMNRGSIVPGSAPVTAGAQTATTNAAQLMAQANPNLNALNTGALPAGAQSAIDQAANSAKAQIRSNFASMGITGPYSGEAEALAAVDQQRAVQQNAQAQELVNTGVREAQLAGGQQGLAADQYLPLMSAAIRQNEQLQLALARFAAGLA